MSAATDVSVMIIELMPLLDQLAALVGEVVTDPSTAAAHHAVIGSPAPWHPEAGMLLLTIHEEARRLEASLREQVAGHLGSRRGGSPGNTAAALGAIARLVYGVPEEDARAVGRVVARWLRSIRQIRDIDLEDRWGPWPVEPGQLPPKCPYCHTYSLRVTPRIGLVACINQRCVDNDGNQPLGQIDPSTTLNSKPMVAWNDGRIITYGKDWA